MKPGNELDEAVTKTIGAVIPRFYSGDDTCAVCLFPWLRKESIDFTIHSTHDGEILVELCWISEKPKWIEVAAKGETFALALSRAVVIAGLKRGMWDD